MQGNNEGISRSRRLSAAIGALNTSDRPFQTLVIKRGQGDLYRLDFSGKPNVFRIYPGLDPDNSEKFDPWRFSVSAGEYGQWFYPVVTANVSCQASGQGRSWVMCHPLDTTYDMTRNPVVLMRNAIKSALNQKLPYAVNWLGLIQGGQGRGEELAGPKECWLLQVALMEQKGRVYNPPKGGGEDDNTVFLLLTTSAVQALKSAMELRKPDFHGDPDDIAGHFANGDPVALNDGAYVVIFPRGNDPRVANNRSSGFGGSRDNSSSGGNSQVKGYDAYLTKDYNGIGANLADYEDIVRKHVKPWEEAIHFPTNEEQVKLLEQVYRPFSDLLVYALEDSYGRFLDPAIRQEGLIKLGRMRAPDPAMPQPPVRPAVAVPAVTAQAPSAPSSVNKPRTSGFGAPSRSSESPDVPTSTHGISESPDIPVVRNSLSSQEDADAAMALVAKARREAMRGSAPRSASN